MLTYNFLEAFFSSMGPLVMSSQLFRDSTGFQCSDIWSFFLGDTILTDSMSIDQHPDHRGRPMYDNKA